MLAEDAIKSAINNYYTKHPKAAVTDLGGTDVKVEVEVEKTGSSGTAASL